MGVWERDAHADSCNLLRAGHSVQQRSAFTFCQGNDVGGRQIARKWRFQHFFIIGAINLGRGLYLFDVPKGLEGFSLKPTDKECMFVSLSD